MARGWKAVGHQTISHGAVTMGHGNVGRITLHHPTLRCQSRPFNQNLASEGFAVERPIQFFSCSASSDTDHVGELRTTSI